MKKFNVDVFLDGKLTFEVFADSEEEAKEMVNDVMNNSSFKELKLREKSSIDVEMKANSNKELER